MDKSVKYEVELFGQKFVLSTTDGEKEELKKVVDYYKKIIEQLMEQLPNRQHLDIAILAGLKIADKLYSLLNSNTGKNKKVDIDGNDKINKIVSDVIKRLDISLGL